MPRARSYLYSTYLYVDRQIDHAHAIIPLKTARLVRIKRKKVSLSGVYLHI